MADASAGMVLSEPSADTGGPMDGLCLSFHSLCPPSPFLPRNSEDTLELEEMSFVKGKEVVQTELTKGRGKQALLSMESFKW